MLNIIFVFIIAAILILLIIAALQPADFQISRSEQITAPVSAVFDHVNNLQHWNAWSPWAKLDPLLNIRSKAPKPELVQLCDGLGTVRSVQAQ